MPGLSAPASLPPEILSRPPSARCIPVVLDANAAINDVIRRTRTGFTMLSLLAEQRLITLLAPAHIEKKVDQHLGRVAMASEISPAEALRVWNDCYRPRLRLVDLPPDVPQDPRVVAVAMCDPEDAPVAQLARLVGPALVLTRDKHLTDAGFGQEAWLDDVRLLHQLTIIDAAFWGGGQGAAVAVRLLTLAARSLVRLVMRSELALALALASVILVLTDFRLELRDAATWTRAKVEPGFVRLLDGLALAFERRAVAQRALGPRLVPPSEPRLLCATVAHHLAMRSEPLLEREIWEELEAQGHHVSLVATRDLLLSSGCFVTVPGQGWELGRLASAGSASASPAALPLAAEGS